MTRLSITVGLLVLALTRAAQAQVAVGAGPGTPGDFTIASFDPENAVAPISIVQGPGIKIGEGTVIHPVVGVETGFVSNVFYENLDAQPAGILRVLAQFGVGSLRGARLKAEGQDIGPEENDQGSFAYDASVRLAYDQMLTTDNAVNSASGLNVGALFRSMVNPSGKVSLGLNDNFTRTIRAANFETTQDENRDINVLSLSLLFRPPGRSLSGYLYYNNTIDVFEHSDNLYPDRMDHRFGVRGMWRWLPQTILHLDVSGGVITGIGSSPGTQKKVTSFPLTAVAGITTLLSLRTTLSLFAGYTNGFYSSGPSYSAPKVDLTLAYRYSPLGRVGIGYQWMYVDSVNANYFRDHLVRAFIEHGVEPFVLVVQPELHFREYAGVTVPGPMTRDDVIFAVVAGAHYTFRNWIAATLDYRFSTVQTDYRYMDATGTLIDPSYVRHELLAGVRVAM